MVKVCPRVFACACLFKVFACFFCPPSVTSSSSGADFPSEANTLDPSFS